MTRSVEASGALRVLVGCEFSGVVRRAFRDLGHDAWSCDIIPAEDGSEFHYQCDVRELMGYGWDLGIFFPPCTYLTNSGVHWLFKPNSNDRVLKGATRWAAMFEGASLFNACLNAPIPRVCVENPIMHKYAAALVGGRATQYVQPWHVGHKEIKSTGLRLRNLPKLRPTSIVGPPPKAAAERKQWARVHRMAPGPNRGRDRSRFLPGFAAAMAEQWGGFLAQERAA